MIPRRGSHLRSDELRRKSQIKGKKENINAALEFVSRLAKANPATPTINKTAKTGLDSFNFDKGVRANVARLAMATHCIGPPKAPNAANQEGFNFAKIPTAHKTPIKVR